MVKARIEEMKEEALILPGSPGGALSA